MADEQKTTFPMISAKNWWALRKRFQQTIPATVNAGYVAAVLGIKETSARANVVLPLIALGIIDKDGKPLDRAIAWRDDGQYVQVCKDIREEIYPRELLDALPGAQVERDAAKGWFAGKTGVGVAAARRMAALYELLSEADVSKGTTAPRAEKRRKGRAGTSSQRPSAQAAVQGTEQKAESQQAAAAEQPVAEMAPALHIDIQIHIPADASPEYIDQIFASMAKHLYGR